MQKTTEMRCEHSNNEKRLGSKNAQERCDRIFPPLFVRNHPMKSEMGVVLSVGKSAFSVFLPSLGTSNMLFLQEHTYLLSYAAEEEKDDTRKPPIDI